MRLSRWSIELEEEQGTPWTSHILARHQGHASVHFLIPILSMVSFGGIGDFLNCFFMVCPVFLYWCFFFGAGNWKPRASHILSKCSTTELNLSPLMLFKWSTFSMVYLDNSLENFHGLFCMPEMPYLLWLFIFFTCSFNYWLSERFPPPFFFFFCSKNGAPIFSDSSTKYVSRCINRWNSHTVSLWH